MSNERGAATLLAVTVSLIVLSGLLVVGRLGHAVVLQRRAAAAADLTALAAANAALRFEPDPCGAAAHLAQRNGASVAMCQIRHRDGVAEFGVRVTGQRRAWPLPHPVAAAAAELRPLSGAGASPP